MVDNYFKSCPPVMSDGRIFTDYRTSVRTNEYIKHINGIERDDEYRIFLQTNAQRIMDEQWKYLRENKSCWINECVHNYPTRMYPPLFNEERKATNAALNNLGTMNSCQRFNDYRATESLKNKCRN